jgi:hypothetical protein
MFPDHQRIQRREYKDFQPLSLQIVNLDIVDPATRRDFICVVGPVWKRFNAATRGAKNRRITALFLSNEANTFDALLFVGCDYVRRRERHWNALWTAHPAFLGADSSLVEHVCVNMGGRSVLTFGSLRPFLPRGRLTDGLIGPGADAVEWPAPGVFAAGSSPLPPRIRA